jgi:hypothetical protein
MSTSFLKDPDATLDYKVDWSGWLQTGETIDTCVVTAETGITVEDGARAPALADTDTSVVFWLSGGTAGTEYNVTCQITTDAVPARTDERTIRVVVKER